MLQILKDLFPLLRPVDSGRAREKIIGMDEALKQRRLIGSAEGIRRWRELARAARAQAVPLIRILRGEGKSYREIARALNRASIPSVRNSGWSAAQVLRIALASGPESVLRT